MTALRESPDLLGLLEEHGLSEIATPLRRLALTCPDVDQVVALRELGFERLIDTLEMLRNAPGRDAPAPPASERAPRSRIYVMGMGTQGWGDAPSWEEQ